VAVGAVIVVPRLVDPAPDRTLPGDAATPTPTPAPSPEPGTVLPPWDPATVSKLPFYPIGHIPTVLAPVGSSQSRPGDTTGVLALSRSANDRLAVFYGERSWYGLDRVPEVGDVWASGLSPDGTRMAVAGEGGLFWCAAAEECPVWTRVDGSTAELGEDVRISWTAGVSGPEPSVVSAADDSSAIRHQVPFESMTAAVQVDPQGDDGLVVLDRDRTTRLAFLPFTGPSGEWVGAGQARPIQWINKLTVLVSVRVDDRVWLVTWNYRSGDMGYVTWYPTSFDVSLRDLYPA